MKKKAGRKVGRMQEQLFDSPKIELTVVVLLATFIKRQV